MANFDEIINRRGKNSAKWDSRFIGIGEDELLPFWVADTDFKAPKEVNQALMDCVEHGIYGYTLPPDECASSAVLWQEKRHGFKAEKDWVSFISGIDCAIATTILALTNPGDKIIVQTPIYSPFFEMIEKNDRIVVENPMKIVDGRYIPDFEDFKNKAKDAKLWMFCNPQNPSARCYTKNELEKFAKICIEEDLYVLSDEIHADIVFDNLKHIPIASLSKEICDRTITCTSPSKTFSVAGLVASVVIISNEDIRNKFNSQKDKMAINTAILGLVAMQAAYLNGEKYADEVCEYLEGNRDFALEYIKNNIPKLNALKPEATFLLWIDCKNLEIESVNLEKFFIDAGVRLSMGNAYLEPSKQFVRLNFGCTREILRQGLEKIEKAVNAI